MRLLKTGHEIADTVSDLIGELPDGDYNIAYGILRHNLFSGSAANWFEIDKGMWGASHYGGNYRLSFRSTQPIYHADGPAERHELDLQPWRQIEGLNLICPPTDHVCQFFKIDAHEWMRRALAQCNGQWTAIRRKGDNLPVLWDKVARVITFNSSIGIEALQRGIPVISDPVHSSIGSYTNFIGAIDDYNRDELLSFIQAHQMRLGEKEKICRLISYYLSKSL